MRIPDSGDKWDYNLALVLPSHTQERYIFLIYAKAPYQSDSSHVNMNIKEELSKHMKLVLRSQIDIANNSIN